MEKSTSSNTKKKQQQEPGPERPTDDSQAGVTYISFEDLQLQKEIDQQNFN